MEGGNPDVPGVRVSGNKTMKALLLRKHGELDGLALAADYPMPSADAEHVVIRVRASSFNYHDVFTVRGMPGNQGAAAGRDRARHGG